MREVVIGIVEKNHKILMIKRAKQEQELLWAFPGGKVNDNETREEACIREVYEETGITVGINQILGTRIHPNTQVKITYFLCDYIGGNPKILDKNEVLEVSYKSKQELEQVVKTDIYPPVKKYIYQHIK